MSHEESASWVQREGSVAMTASMFHSADAYDRLMGRYLPTLAPAFADLARVEHGQRALDVGCGPGGLSTELAERLGASHVTGVDPSPAFVAACRERVPGAVVVEGVAEALPFADDAFDASLSSLVVGFMSDAPRGVAEMARVTRPGGAVALNFWDIERMQALGAFWRAAGRAIGAKPDDRALLGSHEGDLARLLEDAGLVDVRSTELNAVGQYTNADDLWSGYTAGIGLLGKYVAGLDPGQLSAIREALVEDLPDPDAPFCLHATAWAAVGTVPA